MAGFCFVRVHVVVDEQPLVAAAVLLVVVVVVVTLLDKNELQISTFPKTANKIKLWDN